MVIHCAGVSRQILGSFDKEEYRKANVAATRKIARMAALANPDVHFIFLSSVLVYGEDQGILNVSEEDSCRPSCDYSLSKLEAEAALKALFDSRILKQVHVLRLAQVYDTDYTINLDKRVFLPFKLAFLKIGKNTQKMSALSRVNLMKFILFLMEKTHERQQPVFQVYNVTDIRPYSFSDIIGVFRKSCHQPDRLTLPFPLWCVRGMIFCAKLVLPGKKHWLDTCYNKLTLDFIYDNTKMLKTGFVPAESIDTIFLTNNKTDKGQHN